MRSHVEKTPKERAPRFRNIRYADCDILRSQSSSLNVSA